jgi:hypothetical protein
MPKRADFVRCIANKLMVNKCKVPTRMHDMTQPLIFTFGQSRDKNGFT